MAAGLGNKVAAANMVVAVENIAVDLVRMAVVENSAAHLGSMVAAENMAVRLGSMVSAACMVAVAENMVVDLVGKVAERKAAAANAFADAHQCLKLRCHSFRKKQSHHLIDYHIFHILSSISFS